jgi:ketosteroid isomerase-like protein
VSPENVALVRRSWEAWERGDMEAIFAFYDPDIVWDQFPFWEGELASLYRGHDGIRQLFREWLEAFEGFYAHAEDFIDAGDAVVVPCRQGGRGKQSGAEVRMPPPFGWSTDSETVALCESRPTPTKVKPSKPLGLEE